MRPQHISQIIGQQIIIRYKICITSPISRYGFYNKIYIKSFQLKFMRKSSM
jgi:hypothetical protein